MFRIHPLAVALFCAVAACSPAPESSAGGLPDVAVRTAGEVAPVPEITAEKISRDVIGRIVKISEADGHSPPTDWTFDADEVRQVEILESEATPAAAAITVFMMTRDNPEPGEDTVLVSGKLRLHYQRKGAEWVLTTIDNLTFHYTIGIST